MNSQLSLYYAKYKTFLMPGVLIFLTFFIVFRIILPEISNIFSLQADIETKSAEVSDLQISLDNLASQNDAQLAADFKTVNSALPTIKDIGGMFSALSLAAGKSNVTVRGFSLKVGKLFGGQAAPQSSTTGIPFLTVNAKVSALDSRDYVSFLSEVQKSLPISEVKNMSAEGQAANFDINFYYKPLDISALIKQEKVLPLTKSEKNLLNQLKEWQQ